METQFVNFWFVSFILPEPMLTHPYGVPRPQWVNDFTVSFDNHLNDE